MKVTNKTRSQALVHSEKQQEAKISLLWGNEKSA